MHQTRKWYFKYDETSLKSDNDDRRTIILILFYIY